MSRLRSGQSTLVAWVRPFRRTTILSHVAALIARYPRGRAVVGIFLWPGGLYDAIQGDKFGHNDFSHD